jgi:putative holliday junction resolvase
MRALARLWMGAASRDARAASMTAAPTQPAALRTSSAALSYLAFDFGAKRIGVASGNTVTRSAAPLTTVTVTGDRRFQAIETLILEWRPDALVVGVPRHPDGAPHENTALAQRFARQLHGRFALPVHEVDERYTTTQARAAGAKDLDAAAAAIILEQFLNPIASPHE